MHNKNAHNMNFQEWNQLQKMLCITKQNWGNVRIVIYYIIIHPNFKNLFLVIDRLIEARSRSGDLRKFISFKSFELKPYQEIYY